MSDPLPVRAATASDLLALHALIESGYRGDRARGGWTHEADLLDGQRTDVATLAAILADPGQRLLMIGEDGAPVGCVNIADQGGGMAYLGLLCVAPEWQAKGLGKQLILEAENCSVSIFGTAVMEMTVLERRPELIAYYERRGYARTGERRPLPVDADFDLLILRRRIG